MEEHELLTRYYSQLILNDISISDQTHLWDKHVSVVGLGGLGSPLAVYPVSYTHLPSPRDLSTSRMPSSA